MCRFSVGSMPRQVAPLYKFATKVVALIRARTPKVVYHTTIAVVGDRDKEQNGNDHCEPSTIYTMTKETPSPPPQQQQQPQQQQYQHVRCMLMEDGPTATFDVRFYKNAHHQVRLDGDREEEEKDVFDDANDVVRVLVSPTHVFVTVLTTTTASSASKKDKDQHVIDIVTLSRNGFLNEVEIDAVVGAGVSPLWLRHILRETRRLYDIVCNIENSQNSLNLKSEHVDVVVVVVAVVVVVVVVFLSYFLQRPPVYVTY